VITRSSTLPLIAGSGKSYNAVPNTYVVEDTWVRPSDWLSITPPSASENKFVGLVAVHSNSTNYIALNFSATGGYTVDWGDGSAPVNVASGTKAQYDYSYSSLNSGTYSTLGYRQAIVTVTPTTPGQAFTTVNLGQRHDSIGAASNGPNKWLDIAISAPNATTMTFTTSTGTTANSCSMPLLEHINVVSHARTSYSSFFANLGTLKSVELADYGNCTSLEYAFHSCRSLPSVPSINTQSCTSFDRTFVNCYSLRSMPLMNTSAVTIMNQTFANCYSLSSVPLFNTASVTNMQSMFAGCRSLQSVPLFNTTSVTNMAAMFSSCISLTSVPLFNTSSVTSMSSMFNECRALKSVPLFNTASTTNMASMFYNCASLKSVPLFNTASVTNMSYMFYGCSSLKSVPLFSTASVTTMNSMFATCTSLNTVPLFNTASVADMSFMFQNCTSLNSVPLFNTASVTTMQSMFSSCESLFTIPQFNTSSVTNMISMFNTAGVVFLPALQTANVVSFNAMLNNALSIQMINGLNMSKASNSSNNLLGTSAAQNITRAVLTGMRWSQSSIFVNGDMGATELDEMYTALAVLNPNVTNASGNGTTVTYTVSDISAFVAARTVTMTGIDPVAYNLTNVTVASVNTANNTFTVNNAATGTYVSGGVAAIQDNRTVVVTSNPGTASDNPSIATNKGWTVTG
jgi:surface protein